MEVYGFGGQAFGAFLNHGQHITLHGEANDYFGKGLSGGKLAVCPAAYTKWNSDDVLVGNVALYGATGGEAYVAGQAGERFCVRNSGASAVVEGVGDHGCEYMTGGRVVILGRVGVNFAAGMTGGLAYVYDENGHFDLSCNSDGIDLESIEPGSEGESELKNLIQEHYDATGSRKAADMLDDWEQYREKFVRVFPVEYRNALKNKGNR